MACDKQLTTSDCADELIAIAKKLMIANSDNSVSFSAALAMAYQIMQLHDQRTRSRMPWGGAVQYTGE